MPSRPSTGWPALPRLADQLDRRPDPLGEGASWSGIHAGPDASYSGTASECEVIGSRLDRVRLTGAELDESRFVDVVFEDCELSAAALERTTLMRVLFHRCRMSGLIATGIKAEDLRFADCKIDGANFRGSTLERCAFEDCDLAGADFYHTRISVGAFRRCRLTAVEFSKARCDGLDLRGSILDGLRGAASLRGCTINSDQMVPLGLALLAGLEVHLENGDLEDH
jgi:uncharacterized protein YjbI with pentapeptide repeats